MSVEEARNFAATIAQEVRGAAQPAGAETEAPHSVFVVYGHDGTTLEQVDAYLRSLGIETVVLSRRPGPAQSLFQKFLKSSKEARFAVVILTADDFGASRLQYEADGVADKAPSSGLDRTLFLSLASSMVFSDGRTCSLFTASQTRCFRISRDHPISMALYSIRLTIPDNGARRFKRSWPRRASTCRILGLTLESGPSDVSQTSVFETSLGYAVAVVSHEQ